MKMLLFGRLTSTSAKKSRHSLLLMIPSQVHYVHLSKAISLRVIMKNPAKRILLVLTSTSRRTTQLLPRKSRQRQSVLTSGLPMLLLPTMLPALTSARCFPTLTSASRMKAGQVASVVVGAQLKTMQARPILALRLGTGLATCIRLLRT